MIEIKGPWKQGFAFDKHSITSTCTGHNQWGYPIFDTVYTAMGKCVNSLKYGQQIEKVSEIVDLLKADTDFIELISSIDSIIPVPPSNKNRIIQPVLAVSQKVSEVFGKEFLPIVLNTANSEQIKGIDTTEKYDKVKKSLKIDYELLDKNKSYMVFDDLFDSGSTLKAYVDVLKENGYNDVSIFTLTKTRIPD